MSEEDTNVEEISEEEFKKAEDEAEKEFEESKEESEEETEEESEEEEASAEEPKEEEKKVDSFNREMHDAVCADCGKKCEVPFKPAEGRPVYCRDCYRNHMPQRRRF